MARNNSHGMATPRVLCLRKTYEKMDTLLGRIILRLCWAILYHYYHLEGSSQREQDAVVKKDIEHKTHQHINLTAWSGKDTNISLMSLRPPWSTASWQYSARTQSFLTRPTNSLVASLSPLNSEIKQ